MDDVLASTSTEIDSEEVSEYEPEPIDKISKPLNVTICFLFQVITVSYCFFTFRCLQVL